MAGKSGAKKQTVIRYKKQAVTAGRETITVRAGKGQHKTIGSELYAVRVDERGRVTLPARAREELGIQPGMTFYVEKAGYGLRLARPENPFDELARYAIAEDEAGRTRNLREYARERGLEIGGE